MNEYLGAELRRTNTAWQTAGVVNCENTAVFSAVGQRPDLIIADNPMSPVGIETEYEPAGTVESDAKARLGQTYLPTGGKINSVLAVRIPARYRKLSGPQIAKALGAETQLQYCLITGNSPTECVRWPTVGYISASVADLAYVVATARVPQAAVDQGADVLEQGANVLAAMLRAAAASKPQLAIEIANSLKQEATDQTYVMAATILINAFVFQETIAGTSGALADVRSVYDYSKSGGPPTKQEVISEWSKILKINYWPIFGVAKSLLASIPTPIWKNFASSSLEIADKLLSLNLGKNPDLVGTIFQRLISDRRFLATFYTAPASAALLARLLVRKQPPTGSDWASVEASRQLKIADFACGTGSLLSALYSEVRTQFEHAGIDSKSVHRWMVENALIGCDVLPSATHITASQLSSVHPTVQYKNTKILTMPFGRLDDGGVALGAFDLLEKQAALSTIATNAGEVGALAETGTDAWKALGGTQVENQSFDIIAMNPPFTRLTGGGGKSTDVSRPLFAAFGTSEADQADMAKRAARLFADSAYHGNAGAASAFVELAHRKIKEGGSVGLILPISALSGISWEDCRRLWRLYYSELIVFSIASDVPGQSTFSADTSTAECMIIARRSEAPGARMISVSLYRRPMSILEGAEIARSVLSLIEANAVQGVDDGPLGGTAIQIGEEKIGEVVSAPISVGPWSVSRMRDHAVAQVAFQLVEAKVVWLPGSTKPQLNTVTMCRLSDLGTVGPYHLDISGPALSGGAPRGPFALKATSNPDSVTFPALVAHNEQRERHLELAPDQEAIARVPSSAAAGVILQRRRDSVWATRSRLHLATDVRFNANALIACLTTREAIGGRAWPSFVLNDRRYEKALALWLNSSLGILAFWWLATKSQDGRGSVTTSRLGDLPCFDPRTLSAEELATADKFFDDFKNKHLLDIHELATDDNRAELDRFVAKHFLRAAGKEKEILDGLQLLRAKIAIEPSISGGADA